MGNYTKPVRKGLIGRIKELLPNKMTAKQRADYKMKKLDQKTSKSAISEAGKTIRSVTASVAGTKIVQGRQAMEAAKRMANNNENINKALSLYEEIIKANPQSEGNSGDTSTTQVGGAGSAISG